MYYPILRGRQNELLAIKELLRNDKLSKKIIPVVEPVKLSATLVNTMDEFASADHSFVLIRNPKVGSFSSDAKNPKNVKYKERLADLLTKAPSSIKRGLYVDKSVPEKIKAYKNKNIQPEDVIAICIHPDQIKYYEEAFSNYRVKTMLPYAPAFRRIHSEKILTDNKFNKKARNVEYMEPDDEFFSDDHLYFSDGYIANLFLLHMLLQFILYILIAKRSFVFIILFLKITMILVTLQENFIRRLKSFTNGTKLKNWTPLL